MLNRALVNRNLARILGRGPLDLADHAVERHELCPAEDCARPAALYPEGALERVTALSPWRDWDTERGLIEGRPIRHAATEALVLREVVLAGTYLYRGRARERVGHGPARLRDPGLPIRSTLPEAHLVSGWTGADFWGHFIQDTLPLEMIPVPPALRIAAPTRPYPHAAGYRTLLTLPAPAEPGHALIDRLILYRDFSQNSYKQARYRDLRARLRRAIGPRKHAPGIFLRRGESHGAPRRLINEDALIDLLAGMGFAIIDPERTEADTILRRALDAPVVVSVEGSHLGHAIYTLGENGAFLVIQPPDRFAMPYKEIADCLGMRFGFVTGHPAVGGFSADLEEIRQMLERLT